MTSDRINAPLFAYGKVAVALHWTMAALVLSALALGMALEPLEESDAHAAALALHRSLGILIFILTAFRIIWRLGHRPAAPAGLSNLQRRSAGLVHGMLYLMMFAMPLTGYLATILRAREILFFGLVPVPALLAPDRALGKVFNEVHAGGQVLMLALLAAHVGAAVYHHFVLKDGVSRRMAVRRLWARD